MYIYIYTMYKYYDTLPGVTINKKNQQNEYPKM